MASGPESALCLWLCSWPNCCGQSAPAPPIKAIGCLMEGLLRTSLGMVALLGEINKGSSGWWARCALAIDGHTGMVLSSGMLGAALALLKIELASCVAVVGGAQFMLTEGAVPRDGREETRNKQKFHQSHGIETGVTGALRG
ncbi:hypothetical protein SRHO_G00230030 [Serrasalmus rhombeus]